MPSFKAIAKLAPVVARYQQTAAAGTAPDGYIFVNPSTSGEHYRIVEARAIYGAAGGTSAAADVVVAPSGTAISSGTSALASAIDLTATAATPYTATLTATDGARLVPPGSSVAINTSGTLTGLTGLVIEVVLVPFGFKRTLL